MPDLHDWLWLGAVVVSSALNFFLGYRSGARPRHLHGVLCRVRETGELVGVAQEGHTMELRTPEES